MQISYQVGTSKVSTKQQFEQCTNLQESSALYVHKKGFTKVQIKIPNPLKLPQGYSITEVEVSQFSDMLGTCEKAYSKIKFVGEIILAQVQDFNKALSWEILQYVDTISNQLRKWCETPITNLFLVHQKGDQSLGYKHTFIQVHPVLHDIDKEYYFQCQKYFGDQNSEQHISCIEKSQKIQGSPSISTTLQYICNWILFEKEKEREREERRKARQEERRRRREEEARRVEEEKRRKEQEEIQRREEEERKELEYRQMLRRREEEYKKQRELFQKIQKMKKEKRKRVMMGEDDLD